MRIGIISDTHLHTHSRRLPPKVAEVFAGVDLIVHAGDAVERGVLTALEGIAPVVFVEGNCDRVEGPATAVVHTGTGAIGVVHKPPRLLQREFLEELFGEPVDAVIHGHTHRASITQMDGLLCLDPGSATVPRDAYRSVILLDATEALFPSIRRLGEARQGD